MQGICVLKFWKIQIIIDALQSEEEANVIRDAVTWTHNVDFLLGEILLSLGLPTHILSQLWGCGSEYTYFRWAWGYQTR